MATNASSEIEYDGDTESVDDCAGDSLVIRKFSVNMSCTDLAAWLRQQDIPDAFCKVFLGKY